ncbi:MAG: M48 family peptidase [Pedosphaera sp.]|nr:M48 family peptidase [Pedosphaera sp.]
MMMSRAEEGRLGRSAFSQVKAGLTRSRSTNDIAMLRRVGERIAAVADLPGANWEFELFESSEVNAFCLPGGKIGFYSGILKHADNEAAVAAVMAHEVAHAVARHGAERLSEQRLMMVIGQGLLRVMSDKQVDQDKQLWMLLAYTVGTQFGRVLPHSRMNETEADRIGLMYMARAGYDPEEAVRFWERMSKLDSKSSMPFFLRTHPASLQRVEDIKRLLPEAKLQYRPR